VTRFLFFHDENCIPCGVAKRYFDRMTDTRKKHIEYIESSPNNELVKKYPHNGVPTLVIIDSEGNELERFTGPEKIMWNIKNSFNRYGIVKEENDDT
jgi:hypothetical protein